MAHLVRLYGDVLGLPLDLEGSEEAVVSDRGVLEGAMELLLSIRQQAKQNKQYELSDSIRDALNDLGVEIQDRKEGATWRIKG